MTRLLGFDLLPRIKQINKVKLYRVESGESDLYPRLTPAMTRPIRWDLIEQNYDQMIKYATAIKQGHRLHRGDPAPLHRVRLPPDLPGHAGGRPRAEDHLRRALSPAARAPEGDPGRTQRGGVLQRRQQRYFYGKGGDNATNRREELEMSVLCLRILQAALVYINTLMLQDVLADPEWAQLLKPADQRGLTPLFWQHVQPYGELRLDAAKRLPLGSAAKAPEAGNPA